MGGAHRFELFALACATLALGLFSVAVVPAGGAAAGRGQAQTAAKKKCKKRGKAAKKKRCKRRHRGNGKTAPPAPPPADRSGPAPSPGPDCGAPISKSEGGNWQCSFSDDFNGTSLDTSKWTPQLSVTSGFTDGTSCFVNSPDNISVSNGSLNLTSRQEQSPIRCGGLGPTRYTSGMVSSGGGGFSQTYGRFEVRARISSAQVKGLQTSLWLWPVDATRYGPWPASGEIDFAEFFSAYPDRAIPYIHYSPLLGVDPLATNNYCLISNPSAFHTYAAEWTRTSITIIYDGKVCLVDSWIPAPPLVKPQPFDQPFFIALTQGLGQGGNAFDSSTTPLPATTTIDYVRVWR